MAEEDLGYATGPGLAKAFEVLSQAPEARLLSLTYKMGHVRAERLIHAMCLILLKRNKDEYDKLLANGDSGAGSFLAEMIKVHGERLNVSHVGGFKISDLETQLDVARVFAVLVREGLCEKSLRDQAYGTALVMSKKPGLRSIDVENVLKEVGEVCGLEAIDEFMQSNTDPASKTGSLTSQDASERGVSHPSSLRSSSVCSSHSLEISSPTITESNMEESKPWPLDTPQNSQTSTNQGQALHCSDRSTNICATNTLQTAEVVNGSTNPKPKPCLDRSGSSQLVASKNTNPETGLKLSSNPINMTKVESQPGNLSQYTNIPPTPMNVCPSHLSSGEVEDTFYSFVILHVPEDEDEALRLKDKLENIISGVGATLSEEFAEPGRSTVCCMEDAINSSAFTLLLLTRNFNTNLSETSTDSAIFNSLEKHYKKNTVIPLLPRENSLPKDRQRLVLRGTVPLDESRKTFARAALKAMAPEKVASQKKSWMTEQCIRKAAEEQKRLQEERSRNMDLQREMERVARLKIESERQQNNTFYAQSAPPRPPAFSAAPERGHAPMHAASPHGAWQQPSCIHIENAQNVMIGNHSTMNIDHDPHSSGEEDD